MTSGRRHPVLTATLLAAPLAALTAWVAVGALNRTHAVDTAPAANAAPSAPAPTRVAGLLPGYPQPEADLSREQLEDRVDGAAEYLRAQGCRRLAYWRLSSPPADLEVLFFDKPEGARTVLSHDAGEERTPGPGDEAQVSDQAVYFRRGAQFVRLFADPGAPRDAQRLARAAGDIDQALIRSAANGNAGGADGTPRP